MGSRRALACAIVAITATACTDEESPPGPCWVDPAPNAPTGEVQLGGDSTPFAALAPDQELTLIHGLQGGHHFPVRARIRGMTPGAEGMTATRFAAFLEDGTKIDVFQCPFRWAYIEEAGTDYLILVHDVSLIVDEAYVPQLPGTRVLLRTDVVDAEGRYATDEKFVIARSP